MGREVRECKCPFCFERFNTEEVVFRAQTVVTEQDMEEIKDLEAEERAHRQEYMVKQDVLYKQFWDQFPNSEPEDENKWNPIISNYDARFLKGEYMRDASGFLNEVIDEYGKSSTIRLCPHCHNTLPFEFGKYPVKYISVVGITSSGKTVYLSQLFTKIEEFCTRANLTVVGTYQELEQFVKIHRIVKKVPLPFGTTPDILTKPMTVNVRHNKTGKITTLVFYDIAGENCVKPEQMKKFGRFIRNSDGIIMIIDPEQFMQRFFRENKEEEKEVARPEKVVAAMWDAFVSSDNEKGKSEIPLAAALSKSDMIKAYARDRFNYESIIFDNIDYSIYDHPGMPYEEVLNTNAEVQRLLREMNMMKANVLYNQLKQSFPTHKFFAFSALNVEPIHKVDTNGLRYDIIDEDPETIRVEEPVLWLLNQLGIVEEVRKRDAKKNGKGSFVQRIFGL